MSTPCGRTAILDFEEGAFIFPPWLVRVGVGNSYFSLPPTGGARDTSWTGEVWTEWNCVPYGWGGKKEWKSTKCPPLAGGPKSLISRRGLYSLAPCGRGVGRGGHVITNGYKIICCWKLKIFASVVIHTTGIINKTGSGVLSRFLFITYRPIDFF